MKAAALIRPGLAALSGWAPLCLAQNDLVLKAAPAANPWLDALRALLIAAFALTLAYVLLRGWRQRSGAADAPAGAQPPQLVHSRRVSQKTTLLVVRWRGRTYLLAETGQTLQVLDDSGDGEMLP